MQSDLPLGFFRTADGKVFEALRTLPVGGPETLIMPVGFGLEFPSGWAVVEVNKEGKMMICKASEEEYEAIPAEERSKPAELEGQLAALLDEEILRVIERKTSQVVKETLARVMNDIADEIEASESRSL